MTFNRRSLFRMLAAAAAAPAAIARAAYGGIVERVPPRPEYRVVVELKSRTGKRMLLVRDACGAQPFFIADREYVIMSAYSYPLSEASAVAFAGRATGRATVLSPGDRLSVSFQ